MWKVLHSRANIETKRRDERYITVITLEMNDHVMRLRNRLGAKISNASLALFFDSMSVLLGSGKSAAETLQYLATHTPDAQLRRICEAVTPQVRNGSTLSAALRRDASWFPEIVIPLLEVGEASGGLADSARRLADMFQRTSHYERKFRGGVYDPRLVLLLFSLIQFSQQVISAIQSPLPSQPLAGVAISIIANVAITAIGIASAFVIVRIVLRLCFRWRALRLCADTIILALPRLGLVTRNLCAARWARSFVTLWSAGVPISSALEISSGSALNAHYERTLRLAAIQMRHGRSLSQCVASTQLLPPNLLGVITASEISGRMDAGLLALATEMENEALARALEEMNKIVIIGYIVLMIAAFGGAGH